MGRGTVWLFKDIGLNTPIPSRNALENLSLNRIELSPPKVPRFGRSRPDSQFRGIAEVVKEFMEYIADSPLLAHNAKFDMRIGISIVPSAARYQSRLGRRGGGARFYTTVSPKWSRVITLSNRLYRFEWLLDISIF